MESSIARRYARKERSISPNETTHALPVTRGGPSEWRARLGHGLGRGPRGWLRALCPDGSLRPAARRRNRGRPPGCPRWARLAMWRSTSISAGSAPVPHFGSASSQGPHRRRDVARDSDHLRPRPEHRLPGARTRVGRDPGSIRHLHRSQLRRLLGLSRLQARVPSVHSSSSPIWPPAPASKTTADSRSMPRCWLSTRSRSSSADRSSGSISA